MTRLAPFLGWDVVADLRIAHLREKWPCLHIEAPAIEWDSRQDSVMGETVKTWVERRWDGDGFELCVRFGDELWVSVDLRDGLIGPLQMPNSIELRWRADAGVLRVSAFEGIERFGDHDVRHMRTPWLNQDFACTVRGLETPVVVTPARFMGILMACARVMREGYSYAGITRALEEVLAVEVAA